MLTGMQLHLCHLNRRSTGTGWVNNDTVQTRNRVGHAHVSALQCEEQLVKLDDVIFNLVGIGHAITSLAIADVCKRAKAYMLQHGVLTFFLDRIAMQALRS